MKKIILISAALVFALNAYSTSLPEETNELVIYAYDSFASEWGPGPVLVKNFEERFGIDVKLIGLGDAGTVLNKAISEKEAPVADLIIGVDNNLLAKLVDADMLEDYNSNLLDKIPSDKKFPADTKLVPFDYGYFSIIYDTEKLENPPASLEDLTKPEYKDSLILMDPRTSSPGYGFLLWTIAVYGDDYLDYWNRLKPSILTISDSWDTGYGLFTSGEAPMVLSYTTSPAYHAEYENSNRYQALIFEEGNYLQIEGVGIIKNAKNFINATVFIDYMISKDGQEIIPTTNWMYPVNSSVKHPESFDYAPQPDKSLQLDYNVIDENYENWLNQWVENQVQ